MPLFHFHLRTPSGTEPDEFGLDYPDLDSAYLDVCRTVPAMAVEIARRGDPPLSYAFFIADANGDTLMEVPFAEPLRAGPRSRPAQSARTRRLSREIAEVIDAARETAQRTRAIVARARAS